jgi:hypothetical protein
MAQTVAGCFHAPAAPAAAASEENDSVAVFGMCYSDELPSRAQVAAMCLRKSTTSYLLAADPTDLWQRQAAKLYAQPAGPLCLFASQ